MGGQADVLIWSREVPTDPLLAKATQYKERTIWKQYQCASRAAEPHRNLSKATGVIVEQGLFWEPHLQYVDAEALGRLNALLGCEL